MYSAHPFIKKEWYNVHVPSVFDVRVPTLTPCNKTAGQKNSSDSLRGLVQGALMLLLSFVGLPGLQQELGQLDAVRIMLARFNDVGAPASLRADAVCILSRLCAGHAENQATFRQEGGIVSLIHQLEAYAKARQPAPREKRGALPPGAFGHSVLRLPATTFTAH